MVTFENVLVWMVEKYAKTLLWMGPKLAAMNFRFPCLQQSHDQKEF